MGGAGPETRQGRAARKVIRQRLGAFDSVPASSHLGGYGAPDDREWRQYFLADSGEEPPAGCPFRGVLGRDAEPPG